MSHTIYFVGAAIVLICSLAATAVRAVDDDDMLLGAWISFCLAVAWPASLAVSACIGLCYLVVLGIRKAIEE